MIKHRILTPLSEKQPSSDKLVFLCFCSPWRYFDSMVPVKKRTRDRGFQRSQLSAAM